MKKIVTQKEEIRIDKYLRDETDYSRAKIGKMLDQECILVNDKPVKASYLLKCNDEITILDDDFVEEIHITPEQMNLDIIYEDNDIIVLNKPSGIVVHPGSGNYHHTLVQGLMYYTKELSDMNGEDRPGIIHRLDKDTSGIMLVAKNNKAHETLSAAFQSREGISKEYVAIVNGIVTHNHGIIDAPIGRDSKDRKKMCVTGSNSKEAVSEFTVLERFQKNTYLKIKIHTGRTHQIRVHMKYIGHPVFNDPVYSNRSEGEFGQYLHAYRISFIHPTTQEKMEFTAPLPECFQEKLQELRDEMISK